MKRLLFVYNPTSGKGAITGNVTTIVDAFTKAGWLVTIYPTQGTGGCYAGHPGTGPSV